MPSKSSRPRRCVIVSSGSACDGVQRIPQSNGAGKAHPGDQIQAAQTAGDSQPAGNDQKCGGGVMAVDARINCNLPAHPKTKKLIRRVGEAGAWRLVCLFMWAAQSRPNGNLEGMTAEDVELAVDWQGEEGAFVRSLVEVGFLDGEEGSYSIHDWDQHNPWAAGSESRAEKASWNALCRHHGRERAAELMPEYAARIRAASSENRSAPNNSDRSSNNSATSMHLSLIHI